MYLEKKNLKNQFDRKLYFIASPLWLYSAHVENTDCDISLLVSPLQGPSAAQAVQRAVGGEDSGVARGAQRNAKVSLQVALP